MKTGFEGRWLTGSLGTERLITLSTKLKAQVLRETNARTRKNLSSYTPWMCCRRRFDFFDNGAVNFKSNETPDLVIDSKRLSFLHEAFWECSEKPFGHAESEDTELRVASPNDPAISRFRDEISRACDFLEMADSSLRDRFTQLVQEILPLGPSHEGIKLRKEGSGLSLHAYRGGIFLSLPVPSEHCAQELAINLVHEMGHQAFMVYQYADPLMLCDYSTPVFSAIRRTNRPALMSFHALAALMYTYEFLASINDKKLTNQQRQYYTRRREQIKNDLDLGLKAMRLVPVSALGEAILEECEELQSC